MARTTIRTEDITASEVTTAKMATDPTDATNLASGTVPTARLGTGTANSSAFLVGDQTWDNSVPTLNLDGTTESSPAEGDFWYQSDGKFYLGTSLVYAGVWSSGGNLALEKSGLAGGGTQTAAWAAGGDGAETIYDKTEEYNGTAWSAGGDLATATRNTPGGCGTLTAGLIWGGWTGATVTNRTEEYDGSSWSGGGNMLLARDNGGSCGTQTAGLSWGGRDYPTEARQDNTEEYDGSSWSTGGDLPVATNNCGPGCGTQTAGLTAGGNTAATTYLNTSLEYNGTAWSSGGTLSTARRTAGSFGTQIAGAVTGGEDGSNLSSTEEYDGTAWSAGGDLITARQAFSTAGTAAAGLVAAGGGGGVTSEEYSEGAATFDQLFSAPGGL